MAEIVPFSCDVLECSNNAKFCEVDIIFFHFSTKNIEVMQKELLVLSKVIFIKE
jgi:hypothetical protein